MSFAIPKSIFYLMTLALPEPPEAAMTVEVTSFLLLPFFFWRADGGGVVGGCTAFRTALMVVCSAVFRSWFEIEL
jgi:hypothetical protein